MIIAIVPMKEKNERLPGKNIKLLNNQPLCFYLLKTLQESIIDKIIVDIDGETIYEIVKKFKLSKITLDKRPKKYCDPMIGGDKLLERFVKNPKNIYCQCHITSPFLKKDSLEKACNLIKEKKYASVFGVTKIQQRVWDCNMKPINHNPNGPIERTQDLNPVYMENGSFFMFTGSYYLKDQKRNGPDSFPFEINFPETIDIDENHDFELAESYLAKNSLGSNENHDFELAESYLAKNSLGSN